MTDMRRFLLIFALVLVAALGGHPGVEAQAEPESCRSFAALVPDAGAPLSFTVPLAYGSFADVEIGSPSGGTVRIEAEALEDGAIQDRRIWVLVPGRVVLLSEVFGVENLLEIGRPLVVRFAASEPVSALLVRK